MGSQSIGIIGLGVMGRNLALNLAEKGFHVAVFDPWARARDQFASQMASEPAEHILQTQTLQDMLGALHAPRIILIMLKAGEPVDALIRQLQPHLNAGDILIDGGNSHYQDTIRREADLETAGLQFIGLGISGGEEGARHGPAMMAGGAEAAYAHVRPLLEAIAASYDDTPCCALLGGNGAGHFIKMVHNGIEYGLMQILSEAYHLMRDVLQMTHPDMAEVYRQWDRTQLASYLVEITGNILAREDDLATGPLIESILDKAGQKGTGRWSSEAALAFGNPAITIAEAVFARSMAALKDERIKAARILPGPDAVLSDMTDQDVLENLHQAVLGAFIVTFAQGLSLIEAGGHEQGWDIDLAAVCAVWRNGCVIRAGLLEDMSNAYGGNARPQNLICSPAFTPMLKACQTGWRETVAVAVRQGLPVPALSSALSYYDSYRTSRLPANLIQAQRDYFGAHSYERTDRAGSFHTKWCELGEIRSLRPDLRLKQEQSDQVKA